MAFELNKEFIENQDTKALAKQIKDIAIEQRKKRKEWLSKEIKRGRGEKKASEYDDQISDKVLQDKTAKGIQHYKGHRGEKTHDELLEGIDDTNQRDYMSTFITDYALIDCTLQNIEKNAKYIAAWICHTSMRETSPITTNIAEVKQKQNDIKNAIGYGLKYKGKNPDGSIITETKCTPVVGTILRRTGRWSFGVRTTYPDISAEEAFTYQTEDQKDLSEIGKHIQEEYTNTEIKNLDLEL